MRNILIIHPYDNTTMFLERIRNHLQEKFPDKVHYFSIKLNNQSHEKCLKQIENHPNEGVIIFLGHGRNDLLYGSKGDLSDNVEFASIDAVKENPENFYSNNSFINKQNIHVFKNKKVFCLSCESSELGSLAFKAGAKTFFGFGEIPTSEKEFEAAGYKVTSDMVRYMKSQLNYIIKRSLVYAIENEYSFDKLQALIKFIANQRIVDFLTTQKKVKERYLLADYLFFLKTHTIIHGDRFAPILQ